MNASKLPLDSPDLYIPQDIRQVVKRVPEWLSPFVRVAVGDCFRERIIRHKEKDEKWEKKKERRRVYERPMVQFDPAITIGEFVLLGWGQKEQEREKQRRTAVDTLALAGILFLLGLALVVSVICGRPALLWYSWAAMAASLCPFNVAISRYVKSQGGRLMPSLFFAINASALLAGLTVVSGILAVLSRTWTPAVIAVFLLAALLSILLSTLQGLRYASAPSAKE